MTASREFEILEKIFRAGLNRVDPLSMMKNQIRLEGSILRISTETEFHSVDLHGLSRVLVTGMGKASARMALGLEHILGNRITDGLISVKYGHTEPLERIRLIEAGHPVPDQNSVLAAHQITDFLRGAGTGDLIINLVSGGGSAVLCSPYTSTTGRNITLEEKQSVSKVLLSCGADIHEINCIRKHLSLVKGGRLAELMYPARSLNLILSDVVGDSLDAIASGATVPDSTTFGDAIEIIRRYGIEQKIPVNVMQHISDGASGKIPDTPKPDSEIFSSTTNILIGTNRHALIAAASEAEKLGFKTEILTSTLTGEAREVSHFFFAIARDAVKWRDTEKVPLCFIAGGETTVTLTGEGRGGRNQEMTLSFLCDLAKLTAGGDRIFFLSAGTDGNDGPTDAAGAFASLPIHNKAKEMGLNAVDFISASDSYTFFEKTEGLLKTGPTGTNVCDIQVLIIK